MSQSAAQPGASAQEDAPSPKLARHDAAGHVSSIAAAAAAASASFSPSLAAAGASSSPSFACLDVACGSGRDMCWLLWEAQRLSASSSAASAANAQLHSSSWRVAGLDVSAGALARAKQLADQLGFGSLLQVQKARLNQSGQWHVSHAATATATGGAPAVDASTEPSITPVAAEPQIAAATADPAASPAPPADADLGASTVSSKAPKPSDLRREKRKRKDAMRLAAAAAAAAAAANGEAASSAAVGVPLSLTASAVASSAPSSPLLCPAQYDLVLMVRFLSRTFIRSTSSDGLRALVKPGGFFLLSTFTDDGVTQYAQPSSATFRLNGVDEIEQLAKEIGWELVCNQITRSEDGRPISDCLFRKPREGQ